ncbi:MAG: aspartyl/asparaginyl beta-hydroxylase domain-containing protein [Steroidobacteraceae bacterium]
MEPIIDAVIASAFAAWRQGNESRALELFGELVRVRPDAYLARLYLGRLLTLKGQDTAAAVQYARALQDAQRRGQWRNRASTPDGLAPFVEDAVRSVRETRQKAHAALLEPLIARHGRAALGRVASCLAMYLGAEPPRRADPRQDPSFLYFPDLPSLPYIDSATIPQVQALAEAAPRIRAELDQLRATGGTAERVFGSTELEAENLRGAGRAPQWDGHYFYRHGLRREAALEACPASAAAIDRLPLARIREHAPEVLFSVFSGGTHLLPHRGVSNLRIVGHLALIVPPECALRVADQTYRWREGEVVLFDDTYLHEAWNRSDSDRVVLIFDLWNPHLTASERDAMQTAIEAIGDFRKLVDAA